MTEDDSSVYVVAGEDLRPLAGARLAEMDANRDRGGSLLRAAEQEADPREAASFGHGYVMQHVAPQVWGEEGTQEELLLYAAVSLLDPADAVPWLGCREHLERALRHLQSIGEREGARRIRARVDASAHEEPNPTATRLLSDSVGGDPGRIAAHDQEMAKGLRRDLRAADALDPGGYPGPG